MDSLFILVKVNTTLFKLSSLILCLILSACDRNGSNGQFMQLSINTSPGGSALASDELIEPGDSITVTLTPDDGYALANVSGCEGQLNQNTSPLTYTINNFSPGCAVEVRFLPLYQLTPTTNGAGTISPSSIAVMQGQSTSFTLNPDNGNAIASVTGCGGSLTGNIYTTAALSGPCSITASFIAQHMVSLNTIQNGSLSFVSDGIGTNNNNQTVNEGEQSVITITPDNGYVIQSVIGCGGMLVGNTYTTGAITAPCAISAVFRQQHTLTINQAANGNISPANVNVLNGDTTTFTITPDNGYVIQSVIGCGGMLVGNTYTTGAITAPCAISAVFRLQHTLTINQAANGNISPANGNVLNGDTTTFTIMPDAGYAIDSVTGCGGMLVGNTYTTGAITAPCAISAVFRQQHTLTINQAANGNISPANVNVLNGDTTTFTITPDNGYVIDSVTGCGGTLSGNTYTTGAITSACAINATFRAFFELNASAGANGSISPMNIDVLDGDSGTFTLTPDVGYTIDDVTGCGGTLTGNTYTTGAITGACNITASFLPLHTVTGSAGIHGSISPASIDIKQGDTTSFNITADNGFIIDTVTGCGGTLTGTTYTTGAISSPCTVTASFTVPFTATALNVAFGSNQSLDFSWPRIAGAGYYRLLENPDGVSGYSQVGTNLSAINLGASPSFNKGIGVNFNNSALFILQTCLGTICLDSNPVSALGDINDTISYIKASNPESGDNFGYSIALSIDGTTLAVGAFQEGSDAIGVNGDGNNNDAFGSGAVYVFSKVNNNWTQQAYLKSSSTENGGSFGYSLSLSNDGNTLATGAIGETSDGLASAGAVHVFTRSGVSWSHQQRLKALIPDANDRFGRTLALSGSGDRLVVGTYSEASNATTIDGDASNNAAANAGAAYIFERSLGSWSQQHYLKASNAEANDRFGRNVSISDDGNTIAVGASSEASASATNQNDDNSGGSGAVYIFHYAGNWSQQAYIKADVIDDNDSFGYATSLSADGNTLAVGAPFEDSSDQGIDANPNIEGASSSGAAYIFTRSGVTWSQQSYIKASNSESLDYFGYQLSLSHNGELLAVSAYQENSDADGIDGDQSNNAASASGAAYLISRQNGSWIQSKYLKAINSDNSDFFAYSIELSGDGTVLGVGANLEDSNDAFDPSNSSASAAGAAYLY